ncbi:MAG: adenylyltransferase/cytidyltransferase family protein, partial [Prevotella sp.]|nr:adenylyltransferase/cytidyltransferase family protein [Prevotella sp.]
MIKVITYGTYDVIHKGHIRLLERAKALGDYLIVGVTADSFDRERGKINVQQSLIERVEAVRATGLADEIIVEEYEGQKIDDIKRLGIDIFTVGSDWEGHFDYLKEFCKVVYLERTQGISSSEIRAEKRDMKIGLVGESPILNKIERESQYVNGLSISGVYSRDTTCFSPELKKLTNYNSIEKLLENSDGVYIISSPKHHYDDIKSALSKGKHVLCESPITICEDK